MDRCDRLGQHLFFFVVGGELDDLLDASGTDHGRHADVQVVQAVFAVHVNSRRQDALLVQQVRTGHGDGRFSRSVEGRAGLQQGHDLAAALTGALDDSVQIGLRQEAGSHSVRQRQAAHGRVTDHRDHVVAVTAQGPGVDVLDRHAGLFSQEVGEASRVQNASHADDLFLRQAREFLQSPDHGVQRVGDADHKGVRSVLLDAFTHGLHDLQVDADQVIAAHARLARHTGGDDADVCAFDGGVVVGALQGHVLTEDSRGFGDVQTLTLRGAFSDVEQDDVAQSFAGCDVGQGAADHTGADKGNLCASHLRSLQSMLRVRNTIRWRAV